MRIFFTTHAIERLKQRWPNPAEVNGQLIHRAFDEGRLPNDEETEWLFNCAKERPGAFMLEYRIYKGFFFVFEQRVGLMRFVTMFKRNSHTK